MGTETLRAGLVQLNAGPDIEPNLEAARPLVTRAARDEGAALVCLPENAAFMAFGREMVMARARTEEAHPALAAMREWAADLGIWLLAGTLAVKVPGEERVANRSFLLDPDGGIAARYDKLHMFDVDLGGGESYRESALYRPGDTAVVAETPWGGLGMTVCYDVRFPHLYRRLAEAGARLLTVPSAFTVPTGEAHWHVLLRARAIETGCFVLAPAQCGTHHKGRRTYGHSLIVDPWGTVLADGGETPGVVAADLDLAMVDGMRERIPSLRHARPLDAGESMA